MAVVSTVQAGGAIAMATQTVNSTVSTFESTASANFTVAQNLTNFKERPCKAAGNIMLKKVESG